jgi:hypothetical protein
MTKHVGIVACSAEGAALCYRTLCQEAPALLGEYMHPEVSMHTHPLREYMVHIRSGNWTEVAAPGGLPPTGSSVPAWPASRRNARSSRP